MIKHYAHVFQLSVSQDSSNEIEIPQVGAAKKILITGIVASGKSTISRLLADETGLPLYELDVIAHPIHKSHYGRNHNEQKKIIEEIDNKGEGIFEGTDRKYQRYLFDWAELIIFIDPPLLLRKRKILSRFMKQKLGIEKCRYNPSLKILKMMYKWTNEFEQDRERFESFLEQYESKVIKI